MKTNMVWFKSFKRNAQYLLLLYPSIWQLPNPIKIHEYRQLADGMLLERGQRVLDIGCGYGIQTQLIARRGPFVVGIDPEREYLHNALIELKWSGIRNRVKFVHGTIREARLPPESFDYACSFCVLEHIPDLEVALSKICVLLKRGGELHTTVDSLTTIKDPKILEWHSREYSVHRYFRADTAHDMLSRAGLDVFEGRYILVSDLAREELIYGLRTGRPTRLGLEKRILYSKLVRQERAIRNPDAGLMLLVRARKR